MIDPDVLAARAADVMVTRPKTLPVDATTAEVRDALCDDHVNLVLLVSDDGVLCGTITRGDVPVDGTDAGGPALVHARLAGRTVAPDAPMADTHPRLVASGLRRLAVIAADGRLLGLLCLKRSGTGYCSDEGVAARAAGHEVPC